MLTTEAQGQLLKVARRALEARVRRARVPEPDVADADQPRCGAFVTIFYRGDLRGCLGRVTSDRALPGLIHHLAQEVADSDPRFDPVRAGELDEISIEVSVLTPEREIRSAAEIEIGRHGLIVERGSERGLLLPQVAVEHGWDPETFIEHTCVKAGLPADAWQRGARMFVFEAQVFGERHEEPDPKYREQGQ
jgi:AmmeMemoRadiSam system protein A